MPRLRMSGAIPVLSHMPSWREQGQLLFFFLTVQAGFITICFH